MRYNGENKRWQKCKFEQILKIRRSSGCFLKLENMKRESLVIVDQHATVNMFLGLVHTARHALENNRTESRLLTNWNPKNWRKSPTVLLLTGVKS